MKMPPKKKGKSNEPSVKEYKFLTLEEMRSRELKYVNRLNELKVCVHYIDGKRLIPLQLLYSLQVFV